MLDLGKLNSEKYKLTDLDGDVITIGLPTQGFLRMLVNAQEITDMNEEAVKYLYDICFELMNSNQSGKVYSRESIEEMDIEIVSMLFEDYFGYVAERLGE